MKGTVKHTINLLFALFCSAMLMLAESATAYNTYYAPPYHSQQDPVLTLQQALNKLKTFSTNSDSINPVLLRSFIENEIIPHFAFDQMTRWIAGPHARQMHYSDMLELEQRVKNTFLASMAKHLGSFDAASTQVQFRPAQYNRRYEATVTAMVYRPNARPARLDFRMRIHNQRWKIIDVKADGSSAVLYYRKYFTQHLRSLRYKPTR